MSHLVCVEIRHVYGNPVRKNILPGSQKEGPARGVRLDSMDYKKQVSMVSRECATGTEASLGLQCFCIAVIVPM